ncbi:MAG: OmpA family protein, partial [Gammaproteobacteria bacterium]|nr:OmpA family protein [Gammaproteobacteria bacterium]
EYEGVQMRVQVHTDNVGTPEHNLRLSKKRANTIKNYLVSLNVNATRIYAQGFGESKPITSNETSNGRARNRRIGISIR